jgi:lipoprotein-anchoring transpeptidase ErfK/SrfK
MDGLERMDKPSRWPRVVGLGLVVVLAVGLVVWVRGRHAEVKEAAALPAMPEESAKLPVEAYEKPNPQTVREAADPPNSSKAGDSHEGRDGGLAVRQAPAPSVPLAADADALLAAGKKDKARQQYLAALAAFPDEALRMKIEEVLGPLNSELIRRPWPMVEKQDVIVQEGDSIKAIARKFGTTVELIVKGNELKRPDVIRPGQHLKVFSGKMEIKVNKSRNDLLLTSNGAFFKRYGVGTGRYDKTPVGTFVIAERIPEPPWWRDDGRTVSFGDKENILGTRWMAIKATGTTPEIKGYGIHGTWDTNSIGKAESAGCIRLKNEDVEELFELVPIGTSVTIEE